MTIDEFPQQVQELLVKAKVLVKDCFEDLIFLEAIPEDENHTGMPRIVLRAIINGEIAEVQESFDKYQEGWYSIAPSYYRDIINLQFDIKRIDTK